MSERQPDHSRRTIYNPNSCTLPAGANAQSKELNNKVILIIGLASERSCRLAIVFAQMGADIAIIYSSGAHDAATRVSEVVKALGRRCLAIMNDPGHYRAHELMQQVITVLGRLDAFVSYPPQSNMNNSILMGDILANGSGSTARRHFYRSLLLPNFSLVKAALHELTEE